jgi:hypothetical protein
MESDEIGRTEPFTPVLVEGAPAATFVGTLLDVAIAGHDGRRLHAAIQSEVEFT